MRRYYSYEEPGGKTRVEVGGSLGSCCILRSLVLMSESALTLPKASRALSPQPEAFNNQENNNDKNKNIQTMKNDKINHNETTSDMQLQRI